MAYTPDTLTAAVNTEFPQAADFVTFLHGGHAQLQIAQLESTILGAQLQLQQTTQQINDTIAAAQAQIEAIRRQLAGH